MGSRADFYIGRGPQARWLGSIAWDGYPSGINEDLGNAIKAAASPEAFEKAVQDFLASRDDATTPDMGWPWPWPNSRTTDFAYAFDEGKVWASNFGSDWIECPAEGDGPEEWPKYPKADFPDMTGKQNITMGKRSGIIVL